MKHRMIRSMIIIIGSVSLLARYRRGMARDEGEPVEHGMESSGQQEKALINNGLQSNVENGSGTGVGTLEVNNNSEENNNIEERANITQVNALEDSNKSYFLETVDHPRIGESDYWLRKHGSDRKVWIGSSETMNLKMAKERAKKMLERGIRVF